MAKARANSQRRQVNIQLDHEDYRRLSVQADELGTSVTALARKWVLAELNGIPLRECLDAIESVDSRIDGLAEKIAQATLMILTPKKEQGEQVPMSEHIAKEWVQSLRSKR